MDVTYEEAIKSWPTAEQGPPTHQHAASGNLYRVIKSGHDCTNGRSITPVVAYLDAHGDLWTRHASEFNDGRFIELVYAGEALKLSQEDWKSVGRFGESRFGYFRLDGTFEDLGDPQTMSGLALDSAAKKRARWVGGPHEAQVARAVLVEARNRS